MTTAQRIIKYLAIAFAIFLTVTIISGIVAGGTIILTKTGLINQAENTKLDNLTTISDSIKEVSSLKMEIKGSDVKIIKGEKFEVQTDNAKVEYNNENGSVVITEERPDIWFLGESYNGNIIIYIPEDMKQTNEVNIKVAAGNISIQKLDTKEFNLDLGAGEITINDLTVSNSAKINGGAGAININSGKIKNLDLDLGVGETNIRADITGSNRIDAGIGGINLNLPLKEQDYRMDIDKGLGEIKLNGKSISRDTSVGQGDTYLKIDGGIGTINITTAQ